MQKTIELAKETFLRLKFPSCDEDLQISKEEKAAFDKVFKLAENHQKWLTEVAKYNESPMVDWNGNELPDTVGISQYKEESIPMSIDGQLANAVNLIRVLALSMGAHPDCTPGSEFEDYVSTAEDFLKSISIESN